MLTFSLYTARLLLYVLSFSKSPNHCYLCPYIFFSFLLLNCWDECDLHQRWPLRQRHKYAIVRVSWLLLYSYKSLSCTCPCQMNNSESESESDGEINKMTLQSRHRMRNSSTGGLKLRALPLGHGGSPQSVNICDRVLRRLNAVKNKFLFELFTFTSMGESLR